ncbi:beta-Tubulin at 65B [Eupeodes corollae]|uniref:beta-Tubulin at 65B n=1 Tax=Eupeodes corollae TaxID=290404 RepID=UPI00249340B4|nr:beta-Tubulin at 65B [Eupeodes corollae]
MREIITLQIGRCGNLVGDAFWDVISREHGIKASGEFAGTSHLQLERMNVYFNETDRGNFYARAIAVDTDRSSLDHIKCGPNTGLYNPDLFVAGTEGTGNNFARGFYTEGAEIMDRVLDVTRLQAESVDSLQGFQIIHSLGGGSGSGFASLLMRNLAEEYPDNLICTFSVIPSQRISDVVVEPYNSVLCLPHMVQNTHMTFCIDNEALYEICHNRLQLNGASLENLNHIIAHTMSGVTTCLRFPGQLNSGLRKLYVNMVPFPNLHFLVPGFAPLTSMGSTRYAKQSVGELVSQIFSSNNLLAAIDLKMGKLLTVAAIFRGRMSPKEVDTLMTSARNKNIQNFVDWIPNNVKTAICDIPPRGLKMSSTFIGNTTAIRQLFGRVSEGFVSMSKRKAHLHWYTGEGMDENEFSEAQSALENLLVEYEDCLKDNEGGKEDHTCQYCSKDDILT